MDECYPLSLRRTHQEDRVDIPVVEGPRATSFSSPGDSCDDATDGVGSSSWAVAEEEEDPGSLAEDGGDRLSCGTRSRSTNRTVRPREGEARRIVVGDALTGPDFRAAGGAKLEPSAER